MPQGIHVPVFVPGILQQLDPVVRLTHGQTIVKADAALLDRQTHAGHSAHVLGNRGGVRVHLMDQLVGQLEIVQGLEIRVHIEVHVIVGKGAAQPMVVIDHAGHAVKAKTVEMVFRLPEFQVAQQEMQHLRPAVVEQFRTPGRMPSLIAV